MVAVQLTRYSNKYPAMYIYIQCIYTFTGLFNLRANDIEYVPVFISFAIVEMTKIRYALHDTPDNILSL